MLDNNKNTQLKSRAEIEKQQDEFIKNLMSDFGADEFIREQQEKAAKLLGVSPDNILVRKDVMASKLSQDGVIVKPHIGRTRFVQKLSERDLGLKAGDEEHKKFFDEYVALGNKFLISKDYLNRADRLDGKARRTVEKYGLQTRWGIFVPYNNMSLLKQEIDEIREQYYELRDDIIANYETIRSSTVKAYESAARHAYKHLINSDSSEAISIEQFVDKFTGLAMLGFPSKNLIYNSFYINLDISFIPLTAFVEEQKARIELVEKQKAIYAKQLENLEAKEEMENMRLQAELQEKIAEEIAKQKAIEEVHKDAISSYKEQMEGFLGDVVGQVYGLVYDAVTEVTKRVEKEGSLTKGASRMVTNMINKVERLNFTDNQEIKDYIEQLQDILRYPAKVRDKDAVMDTLDSITAESRQKLIMLGCEQRTIRDESRSRNIETADVELESLPNITRDTRCEENESFFTPALFDSEANQEKNNLRTA